MFVLRISLSLDIPVFDCSYDVALIGGPQLNFDFISALCFDVLEKQIEPSGPWLNALFVAQDKVAQS